MKGFIYSSKLVHNSSKVCKIYSVRFLSSLQIRYIKYHLLFNFFFFLEVVSQIHQIFFFFPDITSCFKAVLKRIFFPVHNFMTHL